MQLKPAANIIFGFFGGALAFAILRACAHFGYTPTPDIAAGLPAASAIALAHLWDVVTGDNKPAMTVYVNGDNLKDAVTSHINAALDEAQAQGKIGPIEVKALKPATPEFSDSVQAVIARRRAAGRVVYGVLLCLGLLCLAPAGHASTPKCPTPLPDYAGQIADLRTHETALQAKINAATDPTLLAFYNHRMSMMDRQISDLLKLQNECDGIGRAPALK